MSNYGNVDEISYEEWLTEHDDEDDDIDWEEEKESEWLQHNINKINERFESIRTLYLNDRTISFNEINLHVDKVIEDRNNIRKQMNVMKTLPEYNHEINRRTTFETLLQNPSGDHALNESRQIQLEQINEFLLPYDSLQHRLTVLFQVEKELRHNRPRKLAYHEAETNMHLASITKRHDYFTHVARTVDSFLQSVCPSSVTYRILRVNNNTNNQKPHILPACITTYDLYMYIRHIFEIEKHTFFQLLYVSNTGKKVLVTDIDTLPPSMTILYVE